MTLDGLMRPILQQEGDATDSSTTRYSVKAFNAYGKEIFASVPSTSSTEIYGSVTSYDGLQRIKTMTNTPQGDLSYSYLEGNKIGVSNGRGHSTTTSYLAYGSPEQELPTAITQPESATTTLGYNLFDSLTSIVQGDITENRVYDTQQRMCLQKRPDTGVSVYQYNTLGQMTAYAEGLSGTGANCTAYTDVSTAWITQGYDNVGALRSKSYADGSPSQSYVLDNQGNLLKLSSGSGSTGAVWDYSYNSKQLIESETLTIDNQSWILDQAYDSLGSLSSVVYPSGDTVSYAPNALGQATQAGGYATAASYHPNGQLKSFNYGNGLAFTQSVDSEYRPYERQVKAGSTLRVGQRYSYDANDNLNGITDLVNSSKDISLGFDGLDRLTSASGYWGSGSMSYDSLGNITTKTLGTQALTYSYNSNNQLSSVTGGYSFSYDGRGTVLHNGKRGFSVNRANQMTGSDGVSYSYDGHNRRVKKVNGGKTQYSFYSQSGQFLSTTGTNGPTEYVYLGSQLVAQVSQVATADDKPGYTGHLEDKDIGLTYMQQRYYDPVIGRFYSNDPVDMLGHMQKGNPTMGFNRYAYANNNPYKYTDPDGKFLNLATGAIGAAIGGVSGAISARVSTGDWSNSGAAFVAGAVVGGAVGATFGAAAVYAAPLSTAAIEATSLGAAVAASATGAVANAAGDALGQVISKGEITDPGSVISSAVVGAATGPWATAAKAGQIGAIGQAAIPATMNTVATPLKDGAAEMINKTLDEKK